MEIYTKNIIQPKTWEQIIGGVNLEQNAAGQQVYAGGGNQQTLVNPTIVGGTQEGVSYRSIVSGARVEILPETDKTIGFVAYAKDETEVFKLLVAGLDQGDVFVGNYAGGQGLKYDKSANTFNFAGIVEASSIHIPDQTTANSFHTDKLGNSWWGCNVADFNSNNDNAVAYILNNGVAKLRSLTIVGGNIDGTTTIGGEPASGYTVVVDDGSTPANPTGLTAAAGIQGIFLKWTYNTETDMSHYEIWRNTADDSSTATKIGQVKTNLFWDSDLTSGTSYYYWIKAVDHLGNISGFNATAGTTATPRNVETSDITDTAITTGKLADLAVEAAKLANSAVTSTKIANLAVGTAAINNLAVTEAKIDDLAVTNAKINDLDAGKITAGTLDAARIAASSITADKISVTNLAAINADLGAVTAGTIDLPTTGWIKGGQTAYNTGIGFFLGYDDTAYKFSVGDPSNYHLNFNGTDLDIQARYSNLRNFEAIVDVNGHGDYTDIQSALDAGKKRIFVRGGTYEISSAISIMHSDVLIQGEGMNSTIIKPVPSGATINAINVGDGNTELSGIVIRDIQVDGENQDHGGYHGIYFHGGEYSLITKSAVLNCYMYYTGGYGIELLYSNFNTLSGNQMESTHYEGIELYYSDNNTIIGNQINSTDGGIDLMHSNYNAITGNQTNNSINSGISIQYADYNTITGNQCNSNGWGMHISDSDNNIILGNQVNNNDEGIYVYISANYNTIIGNRATGNSKYGVNISDSGDNNNYVRLNYLTGNSTGSFNDAGTGTIKAANTSNDNVV